MGQQYGNQPGPSNSKVSQIKSFCYTAQIVPQHGLSRQIALHLRLKVLSGSERCSLICLKTEFLDALWTVLTNALRYFFLWFLVVSIILGCSSSNQWWCNSNHNKGHIMELGYGFELFLKFLTYQTTLKYLFWTLKDHMGYRHLGDSTLLDSQLILKRYCDRE